MWTKKTEINMKIEIKVKTKTKIKIKIFFSIPLWVTYRRRKEVFKKQRSMHIYQAVVFIQINLFTCNEHGAQRYGLDFRKERNRHYVSRKLFEDPEFPANNDSLFMMYQTGEPHPSAYRLNRSDYQWLRPGVSVFPMTLDYSFLSLFIQSKSYWKRLRKIYRSKIAHQQVAPKKFFDQLNALYYFAVYKSI